MTKRHTPWVVKYTIAGTVLCATLGTGPVERQSLASDRESHESGAVYVNANASGNNFVLAFSRDPRTGQLTTKARYQTGGMGDPNVGGFESHALVSDGRHLYVTNPGDDTVSAFAIKEDGSLRLLNVVPSSGRRPVSVTVHDELLYVANSGNFPGAPDPLPGSYSGFTVRQDGSLKPLPGSTIPLASGASAGEILFNYNGTRLIASQLGGNTIDAFHVTDDGLLDHAAPLAGQPGPFGAIFSPVHHDQFFVGLANPAAGLPAPAVASYRLPDKSSPVLINAVTDAPQEDPCWFAITRDGKHLWNSAFIPKTLTLYSVAEDGHISAVSVNTPNDDNVGSTDISLDSSEHYLYRLRAFDVPNGVVPRVPRIDVFRVTGGTADGGLKLVQTLTLEPDLNVAGIMGMAVVDL